MTKNDGTQCVGCVHLDRHRSEWWCAHFEDEPRVHCSLYQAAIAIAAVDVTTNVVANIFDVALDVIPTSAFKSGGGGDFGGGGATGGWELPTTPEPSAEVLAAVPTVFDTILVAASEAASAGVDALVSAGSTVADVACTVADSAGDVASACADVASSAFD
jgi:hypothetical protein